MLMPDVEPDLSPTLTLNPNFPNVVLIRRHPKEVR